MGKVAGVRKCEEEGVEIVLIEMFIVPEALKANRRGSPQVCGDPEGPAMIC
jgi:hypothetical protein